MLVEKIVSHELLVLYIPVKSEYIVRIFKTLENLNFFARKVRSFCYTAVVHI